MVAISQAPVCLAKVASQLWPTGSIRNVFAVQSHDFGRCLVASECCRPGLKRPGALFFRLTGNRFRPIPRRAHGKHEISSVLTRFCASVSQERALDDGFEEPTRSSEFFNKMDPNPSLGVEHLCCGAGIQHDAL